MQETKEKKFIGRAGVRKEGNRDELRRAVNAVEKQMRLYLLIPYVIVEADNCNMMIET